MWGDSNTRIAWNLERPAAGSARAGVLSDSYEGKHEVKKSAEIHHCKSGEALPTDELEKRTPA